MSMLRTENEVAMDDLHDETLRRLRDEIARLRAQRGEMLNALKTVQDWLLLKGKIDDPQNWNKEFVKANNMVGAAIAKATGAA